MRELHEPIIAGSCRERTVRGKGRPEDVGLLRERILRAFASAMVDAVSEAFDESGRKLRVRGLPGAIARLTQAFGA